MRTFANYFRDSFIVTLIGLGLGFWVGWQSVMGGADPVQTGLKAVFLCAVLGVLEISLSFDNAVVNAKILKDMTPLWRHRFLTWGILIAVFGMRLIFPLAIVGILAKVNPWEAVLLAARHPEDYASMMKSVHVPVAAFGGASNPGGGPSPGTRSLSFSAGAPRYSAWSVRSICRPETLLRQCTWNPPPSSKIWVTFFQVGVSI